MSSFVERHSQALIDVPAGWAATYQACWERCCKHDGIDPGSPFVAFSEGNPYVQFLDMARRQYVEARDQAAVFGYVGLQFDARGKAEFPTFKKTRRKKAPTT